MICLTKMIVNTGNINRGNRNYDYKETNNWYDIDHVLVDCDELDNGILE